jgi:plasmid stabilization system protein ParE
MERATRADWSAPEVPQAIAREMRRNGRRQREIRDNERRVRRGSLPPQPVDPDHLPIHVEDQAPHVFHPIDEDDIRAILHRLPRGWLDGLQAIRLCVDHAEAKFEPRVRDPYTGRLRHEILPGVFQSSTDGSYTPYTATIRLFASLCDPAALGPLALYLKLEAMRTLVHEVAHHFDDTFRKQRNRWGVDDKNEAWARQIEEALAARVVAPYVQERYSSECRELRSWIKQHGGAALSPIVFLGDDDQGRRGVRQAFLTLARQVLTGHEADAARVAFARALHLSGEHDGAAQAVERVLDKQPEHAGALAVRACLDQCVHRDFKAAEVLCARAIASDPTHLHAWEVRVRSHAIRRQWLDAATLGERALAPLAVGTPGAWYLVETVTEAHLHLGDWPAVDAAIARMRSWGPEHCALSADAYLALRHCWAERWEEAHLLAVRLLAAGKHDDFRLWLGAVQLECAHRLGRPHQAGGFTRAELAQLERQIFAVDWVARIREHLALSAR